MSSASTASLTAKVFRSGTHRSRVPEETWDVIAPRLRQFGITRIADVTGLDTLGIPVAMAVRPLAKTLAVSQGKGQTYLLAKISAAMEGIEIWHAEYAPPAVRWAGASAAELGLPYRLTDVVPAPHLWTDSTVLDWVVATGMITGQVIPVPLDLVCFTSPNEKKWAPPGIRQSSNGLASGNCLAEAALHGLYEVLERDALSLMSDDTAQYIDLDSVDDPPCAEMIRRIRSAGASLTPIWLPSRFGIPCFGAQIWSEDFAVTSLGWGAHLAPDIALSRAITEAAQSRLTMIAGSRDDLAPLYHHVREVSVKAEPPHHVTTSGIPVGGKPSFADLSDELGWLCKAVWDVTGIEPMLVDLSTESDFSVVRVIVPRAALDLALLHGENEE
jgi:ribosomal protein S12 methylthiotransferase accessory factor